MPIILFAIAFWLLRAGLPLLAVLVSLGAAYEVQKDNNNNNNNNED